MISIQIIAFILLVARLISVAFIVSVIIKQVKVFGKPIDFSIAPYLNKLQRKNVYRVRRVLFILAVIIMVGNMVPILIDYVTLVTDNAVGRTANVKPISVAYAFSNALTAMFSAVMIWALYKLASLGTSSDDNK